MVQRYSKTVNNAYLCTIISARPMIKQELDGPIAALFDLDGVLIDSESRYTEFWQNVGEEFELPSPTFAQDIKGTTLKDILDTYFATEPRRSGVMKMIHDFENVVDYPLFDGVYEFVDALRTAGIRCAVVTSSDDVKMNFLYGQHPEFKAHFDVIVDGTQVTRSKPDPEGYMLAARLTGCEPHNCFVFEDSFPGLEAGNRAGATVIALATSNPRESLIEKAHAVIDGFVGFSIDDMLAIAARRWSEGD